MPELTTKYMGLKLNSPVIVGAYSLSKRIDSIKAAEDSGAGALVIKSLFEEQLQLEAARLDAELTEYANMIAEATSFHPAFEHGGAAEHLMWIGKARKAVSMPLIASLNAISPGSWVKFAKDLESAGVDGLELNFFSVITNPKVTGSDVVGANVETLAEIKQQVRIPVSVKMSPYSSAPLHDAIAFDKAGADGLVLFNRFAQPDIDIDAEKVTVQMTHSSPAELGHVLRWIGLLNGKVNASLCANTGIRESQDGIKALLAGASSFQVVSVLMTRGLGQLRRLNEGVLGWMAQKGYHTIADFRGKACESSISDPYAFERAQYIKALLGSD